MHSLLATLSLLLSCCFALKLLKLHSATESILAFFCLSSAHVVAWGYALSLINHLSDIRYWSTLGIATAIVSFAIVTLKGHTIKTCNWPNPSQALRLIASAKHWYTHETSGFEKLLLTPLILTTSMLGIAQLTALAFSAPHNWDSETYHIARVAYYLQHNNINDFDANYWAQVVQPKNASLLLLYTYLTSAKNENLFQLVQFFAYWVSVCSIYAISIKTGNTHNRSLFAATVAALLTEWLMEATTTQNDMIVTAYTGATVYFFLAFQHERKPKYLALSALSIALSLGTKSSSILILAPMIFVALYAIRHSTSSTADKIRASTALTGYTLTAILLFTLPSGYIENIKNFGSPFGPESVRREHSFEGKPFSYIAENGTKNLLRYSVEFLSLDGMKSIKRVKKTQALIRSFPEKIAHTLTLELETSEATRLPFAFQKQAISHEDYSYWGIFGFGLVWPMALLALAGNRNLHATKALAFAAILFFIFQSYAGPYDPWRGRYFTACAIFAVPTIGRALLSKNPLIRIYLFLIVLAGCISAVSSVAYRKHSEIASLFTMNRMEQLTRNRTPYYEPLNRFDIAVPSTAVVAVFLNGDAYEYPLFGKQLTRTIIPINPFNKGLQPIPANANYLLYTSNGFPCASQDDLHLGSDWYLRLLTDTNRTCP